jgi:hypothetical protein
MLSAPHTPLPAIFVPPHAVGLTDDGFEGGATTFYTPCPATRGVLDARGVSPVAGAALVFPHGGERGSLVHEGSAVISGAKYVIRTDVLYMLPAPGTAARRGGGNTAAAGVEIVQAPGAAAAGGAA